MIKELVPSLFTHSYFIQDLAIWSKAQTEEHHPVLYSTTVQYAD